MNKLEISPHLQVVIRLSFQSQCGFDFRRASVLEKGVWRAHTCFLWNVPLTIIPLFFTLYKWVVTFFFNDTAALEVSV